MKETRQSLNKTWHLPLFLLLPKQMTRLIHVKNAREREEEEETKRRQFTVTETGTREKSRANLLPSRMRTKNGELAFNAEPSLKGTLRKGRKAIISFGKCGEKEYRSVSSKTSFHFALSGLISLGRRGEEKGSERGFSGYAEHIPASSKQIHTPQTAKGGKFSLLTR